MRIGIAGVGKIGAAILLREEGASYSGQMGDAMTGNQDVPEPSTDFTLSMPGSQSYRTSVYSPGKWKGEQITLSCDVQPASVRLGGAVANHLGQTIK